MNNKNIITSIVLGALVIGGFGLVAITNKNDSTAASNDSKTATSTAMNDSMTKSNSSMDSDTSAGPNEITYKGFAVVQKSIKVKKGSTVTWTNKDNAMHDVTPDTETADFKASKLFGQGETYSMTFNTVGTFVYHCSPHPYMKGTIEVTE